MKTNIKIILTTALSLTAALTISAQGIAPQRRDTLMNIDMLSKVTILENNKGLTLKVNDHSGGEEETLSIEYPSESVIISRQSDIPAALPSDNATTFKCVRENRSRFNAVVRGICLGLNDPVGQTGGGGLEWEKSIEIGWLETLGVNYRMSRHCSLEFGIGFDWRNYKITTSDKRLVVNSDYQLEWEEYPEGSIAKNSRLKVFSIQFPLQFIAKIPGTSLIFSCGPIFNLNTYASVLTRYEDRLGNKYKDFNKNLDNRTFTVDLYGSLTLKGGIGIYARYSPMKVMNGESGINFRPLTLGVEIGSLGF